MNKNQLDFTETTSEPSAHWVSIGARRHSRSSYLAFYSPLHSSPQSIHQLYWLFSAAEPRARERTGGARLEWNEPRVDQEEGKNTQGRVKEWSLALHDNQVILIRVVKYLAFLLLLLFLWEQEEMVGHWWCPTYETTSSGTFGSALTCGLGYSWSWYLISGHIQGLYAFINIRILHILAVLLKACVVMERSTPM